MILYLQLGILFVVMDSSLAIDVSYYGFEHLYLLTMIAYL